MKHWNREVYNDDDEDDEQVVVAAAAVLLVVIIVETFQPNPSTKTHYFAY